MAISTEKRMRSLRRPDIVGVLLGLVMMVGCAGPADENRTGPTTKAELDKMNQERIDAIKKNPNMSEAQKAQALGGLQQNQANASK